AAGWAMIDDVIDPAETRRVIVRGIEQADDKRIDRPWRKHGNILVEMGKVIATAALTGVLATRDQCPAIPYTPKEIGEEAKRAADAGAAIVHIHARTAQGGPDWSVETFAEIFDEVRARTDAIINFSTGGVGIPAEE